MHFGHFSFVASALQFVPEHLEIEGADGQTAVVDVVDVVDAVVVGGVVVVGVIVVVCVLAVVSLAVPSVSEVFASAGAAMIKYHSLSKYSQCSALFLQVFVPESISSDET